MFVVAAVLVLGACSPEETPVDPYQAEIKAARSEATSDFEREVLADGEITDAEFAEARELYGECIEGRGYDYLLKDGMVHVGSRVPAPTDPDEAAAFDKAMDDAHLECEQGTTRALEPLYYAMRDNPNNVDLDEAAAECMVREGFRAPGYSGDDIWADNEVITEEEQDKCLLNAP